MATEHNKACASSPNTHRTTSHVSIIATNHPPFILVVSIWTPTIDGVGYSEPHALAVFFHN